MVVSGDIAVKYIDLDESNRLEGHLPMSIYYQCQQNAANICYQDQYAATNSHAYGPAVYCCGLWY